MDVYFNENGQVIKVVHKNILHSDLKREATRLMFAMPAWQPLADDDGNYKPFQRTLYVDFVELRYASILFCPLSIGVFFMVRDW